MRCLKTGRFIDKGACEYCEEYPDVVATDNRKRCEMGLMYWYVDGKNLG